MLNISGRLVIETKHGRNDPFNIARIYTAVGDFVCMNGFVQQLEEGEEEGVITIEKIFLKSRISGNTAYTEIRAEVVAFSPDIETLPDNVEEEESQDDLTGEFAAYNENISDEAEDLETSSSDGFDDSQQETMSDTLSVNDADASLFGANYPLERVVQIDSTLSRATIRKQADRLSELGYEFHQNTQTWHFVDKE